MPTFDPDIAKIARRNLIEGRDIDARSGVSGSKSHSWLSCPD